MSFDFDTRDPLILGIEGEVVAPGVPRGHCANCILRNTCLPKALVDTPYLDIFESAITREHNVDAGEVVIEEGSEFRSIFAVKSGSVKICLGEHKDNVDGFYFPANIIGMEGFGYHKSINSIVALERSRLCEIDFEKLLDIMTRFPAVHRYFLTMISRQLQGNQRIAGAIRNGSVEQRTAAFLMFISYQYNQRRLSNSDIVLPMPRSDISNYLGVTPESLSRALSLLSKKRVIKVFNRRVSLLNLDELKELSSVK